MAKNVDGAKSSSNAVIAPLNIIVSKYEAVKRERSEAANKQKEPVKSDAQKADTPAGGTGSTSNAGSLKTNNGSPTEANAGVAMEANSENSRPTETNAVVAMAANSDNSHPTETNAVVAMAASSERAEVSNDEAIEKCTVTYISGDHEYARQEVEKGKSVKYAIGKLPDPPEDSRAEFQGWFTRKMGEDNRKKFSESAPIKENITVYAKWVRTINYYNTGQLIGGREIEIESPDKKINVAFNLKSKINDGDINDWRIDRGTG